MNQLDGAHTVAKARLQTIDIALAKLEALVDVEPPKPRTDIPDQRSQEPEKPTPQVTNPIKSGLENTSNPVPIPPQSVQALETFLAGAI